ncbi:putative metallo-beta-lactamase domain [Botryosphaeria dothidea]|uniref:Endoglucanase EG-II n=1 Tax=Botryosphaeria dothidea TaxID=55169 RepID=A0A8H4IMF6_9PEZI|nr:putative metallo-beta-lactamase domain [Botryosphaeria dothidea]
MFPTVGKATVLLSLAASCAAKVQLAGVNIAGFDFTVFKDGSADISKVYPPLTQYGGPDGVGQMQHFRNDLGLNVFRLPVAWQYLADNQLGVDFNAANFAKYDALVQACLDTGAKCIVDLHNYARWNGNIIGQSGGAVTNEHLTNAWWQLATKYKNEENVIFGIMNEPWQVDISTWATTLQWVVNTIRSVGATSQTILLAGNNFAAAGGFKDESGPVLAGITDPSDASKSKLVFEVHQYLDADSAGDSTECVRDGLDALRPLADWLRANGRRAILAETGGGNTGTCSQYVCAELDWMNYNTDVFLGWVGWAAGSFDGTYELVLTPTWDGNSWVDRSLMADCVAGKFK